MLHHPTGVGATALPAALVTASPPSPPLPRSSLSLGGHRQQSQALCRPRRSAFSLHIAVDEHERPQSSAETGCSSVGRRRLWQPAEPAQAGVVAALLRNNMFPAPSSRGLPPPWPQMPQPVQPGVVSFREANHLRENSRRLEKTLGLAKAVQKELETILLFRKSDGHEKESGSLSEYSSEEDIVRQFLKVIDDKGVDVNLQESLSLEAANSLIRTLRDQLAPFSIISSQTTSWEERSVVARLAQKLQKSKRNKRWRKTKRKQIVEKISKKQEMFDKADQEADEWRAKEMAKDIAKRKLPSSMATLVWKLHHLAVTLRRWGVSKHLLSKQEKEEIIEWLQVSGNLEEAELLEDEDRAERESLKGKYEEILVREEIYWKQVQEKMGQRRRQEYVLFPLGCFRQKEE
ncbi:hypothetical protein Taro_020268, partial [Colocasia esculenta]|nr:hypothetical protein [Colocasia esculenta]